MRLGGQRFVSLEASEVAPVKLQLLPTCMHACTCACGLALWMCCEDHSHPQHDSHPRTSPKLSLTAGAEHAPGYFLLPTSYFLLATSLTAGAEHASARAGCPQGALSLLPTGYFLLATCYLLVPAVRREPKEDDEKAFRQ